MASPLLGTSCLHRFPTTVHSSSCSCSSFIRPNSAFPQAPPLVTAWKSQQLTPGRRRGFVCAAPNYNPQNVPDPQVLPKPDFSAEEAVSAQMNSLLNAHKPWMNHGIQTMYEFGYDIGGMERSRYFGHSKDLYHFDHFLGQFQNSFPEVFEMTGYSMTDVTETGSGVDVTVEVQTARKEAPVRLLFQLARQEMGRKKNSFMTKSLKKL